MNNLTARLARADQIAATVRDARCCDALEPCGTCRAGAAEVHAIHHAARVEALTIRPRPVVAVPSQRTLRERLLAL